MGLFTIVLVLCLLCPRSDASCSYLQHNGVTFPTGQCVNSTTTSANLGTSKQYLCGGLLISKMFEYTYPNTHCSGTPSTKLSLGACTPPTCSCTASSHCPINTFTYDASLDGCSAPTTFESQNLTLISDECVNGLYFFAETTDNNRMSFVAYNDSECATPYYANHETCYSALHSSDVIIDGSTSTTQTRRMPPSSNVSSAAVYDVKGVLLVFVVCAMVMATLCSLCCVVRKYRMKRRRRMNVVEVEKNLLPGNGNGKGDVEREMKAEGVVEVREVREVQMVHGEAELIEIEAVGGPGVGRMGDDEEESEDGDVIDVPVAAYSDAFSNAEDAEDAEDDLSEGKEGVEEAESPDSASEEEK